ncbi:vWA domain-containing protein [Streptomyces sp. NPDC055103]
MRLQRRQLALGAALFVLAGLGAAGARADVPAPAADTSVITVKTGGDRTGDTGVTPLAGVRLALFTDEADAGPVADAWARCTSDADGDCSFTVPDTGSGGANAGMRFWVRQLPGGVPAGWFANPSLRTGKGSGSGSVESVYQFRTPALEGGETYSSLTDFMRSTDWAAVPYVASGGTWQQSRVNPPLPSACGLDVAVVLDLSASVGSALPDLKAATDRLTDTLTGTPSRLALFSFDRNSPSTGTANHPALMPVSTKDGAQAFKDLYQGWTLGSGTNWDQGLNAVAQSAPEYDLVVVLTDGNPTRFAKPYTGDGTNTHFADVEGGIFSANAVKAKGSRVVAVGVGKGVEGISGINLKAISGEEAFDPADPAPQTADYYQTTDFAAAGEALRNMALAQCEGTLSVIKQIVPEDTEGEDVTGAEPAGEGWQFYASTTTAGIGGLPDTETTVSDGTGGVVFKPTFPPGVTDADVTVAEAQQPGYELVTQGAKNAVCTNLDDGEPVEVTNTGMASAPAFTVDVPRLAAVSCVVHNRPAPTEPTPTPTEPTPTPTEPTPTPTEPTPTPTEPTPTPTEPTPTPTSSEPTPGPTHPTYPPNPPGGYGDELAEAGSARAQSLGLVALFLATSGSSLAAWKLRRRGRSAL